MSASDSSATRRQQAIQTAAPHRCTAPGPGRLAERWLLRLSVTAFRNFRHAELDCGPGPVVLVGPNGSGKTNLLEAVSLLTPGRGLRRARLADYDRRGDSNESPGGASWAVAATVMTPEGQRRVGTGRDPAAATTGRRAVKVDGAFAAGQHSLAGILSAVWLTPAMDRIFQEGPAARRRFLDRLVYAFDPAHAGRASAYERALRERARLLTGGSGDAVWLDALEQTMAEKAVAIAAARREIVGRLAGAAAQAEGAFPQAGVALAGDAESWLSDAPAVDVEARLRRHLAAGRRRDAEAGGACAGAHRCDLLVTHLGKSEPAALCSTGEQKALLVSLVLAHARLLAMEGGTPPLLLLDEVTAHLDPGQRSALFEELLAIGAQSWISGTDAALFDPLGRAAQRFLVRDAVVLREA